MLRHILLPALVLASSLPACDFSREDPDDGLEASGNGCVDTVTVLGGVEAASALGFSAADVLAVAEGSHASTMTWGEGMLEGPVHVTFGPESGAGELTVGVAYNGGEVRFIDSKPEEGGEGGEAALGGYAECENRLEVDVDVTVTSAGGAFAEAFTAPLAATSRGIGRISHDVDIAAVMGSFALTAVDPAAAEVGPIGFTIGISESGLFGGASTTVSIEEGGAVGAGPMTIASWPAGGSACEFGEAPLGLDAAVALFSGADAVALIAAAPPLSLTWQGSPPTAMTLAVTPGEVVCATDSGSTAGSLRIPATAAIETADGRWSGSFAVEIYATPADDGTLAEVRVGVPAVYGATVPAAEFLATYGLADIDLAGFDEGGIDFSGNYVPADGGASATGQVTVIGMNMHMCSNEPGAPCEGNEYVELDMATWASE